MKDLKFMVELFAVVILAFVCWNLMLISCKESKKIDQSTNKWNGADTLKIMIIEDSVVIINKK